MRIVVEAQSRADMRLCMWPFSGRSGQGFNRPEMEQREGPVPQLKERAGLMSTRLHVGGDSMAIQKYVPKKVIN